MSDKNNIKEIIYEQRDNLKKIEESLDKLENIDYTNENEKLEKEINETNHLNKELEKKYSKKLEENEQLKNKLFDTMFTQKANRISYSKKQMGILFNKEVSKEINSILTLETSFKKEINFLSKEVEIDRNIYSEEIKKSILETKDFIRTKSEEIKKEIRRKMYEEKDNLEKSYDKFLKEPISEKDLIYNNKNNLEMKFGSKIVNIVGIILVLFGVIFGLQYTYNNFLFLASNELKAVLAYIIGILFLISGEFLIRKEKNPFTVGLSAGGLSILFGSTVVSFFFLHVINLYVAMLLCILITSLAFFLSLRYNSKTIAFFAYLGGYLPIISMVIDISVIYPLLAYLVFLNLFTLILATQKKWVSIKIFSFFLNIIGTISIVMANIRILNIYICILYFAINFIINIAVFLIYPLKEKEDIKNTSVFILALNTIFYCSFIYLFLNFDKEFEYNGILAIAFFGIYFFLAKFTEKKFGYNKKIKNLFYTTALTFSLLIIPFQFGERWVTLGWIIEGTVLSCFGILDKDEWFEKAGIKVTALGIGFFWLISNKSAYFLLNYSITSISLIVILAFYYYKNMNDDSFWYSEKGKFVSKYKYVVLVSTYFYLVYTFYYVFSNVIKIKSYNFLFYTIMVLIGFCYSFILGKIKIIKDNIVDIIICAIQVVSIITLIINNFNNRYDGFYLVIILILNIVSVYIFNNVSKYLSKRFSITNGFYEIAMSIYSLLIFLNVLNSQFGIVMLSLYFSMVLLVSSLIWVIIGFMKRIKGLRLMGLYLSLISTAKMLFGDLKLLESEYKILSYFLFGIILIVISYVYNYFNKKIENDSKD